jgi:Bacterial transcriptional activator domain
VLDDPVAALRAERASTYRSLVRARALALSRLGRHAEAAEALTELAAERPRDEEVLLELLRSEAATVGPSAALARYEAYRRSLRDELGADPGPAVQAVHRQLLQRTAPVVRHGVPHEPNPLLGRDDDIAAVANLLRSSRVTSSRSRWPGQDPPGAGGEPSGRAAGRVLGLVPHHRPQGLRQGTCRQLQPPGELLGRQPRAGLDRLDRLQRERCAQGQVMLAESSLPVQVDELGPDVGERPAAFHIPVQRLVGSLGCGFIHGVLPHPWRP